MYVILVPPKDEEEDGDPELTIDPQTPFHLWPLARSPAHSPPHTRIVRMRLASLTALCLNLTVMSCKWATKDARL